jgi:oligopeptide/dipeptide ABC transporter ATP-binding protein
LSDKVLQVDDLVTRFDTVDGTVHAVNGVSFDVETGETVGIVGESGCGKSVTMLSILKLLPQPPARITASRINFQNESLLGHSEAEMQSIRGKQISMVFQDPMTSLNPVLTVGFQIMEPLRDHLGQSNAEAKERAIELLELVGIPQPQERVDNYPFQFSGGMRQRAMIATSLACNPSLLIADEPTTALDVTIQAQMVDLVKRLQEQFGMALIWITHDLGVVAGIADRVLVMYAGYMVEESPVDDLYSNPLHPYTFSLLQSLPHIDKKIDKKLGTIEGLPPDLLELPVGCPFAPRCSFVKETCKTEMPVMEEVQPHRRIACWVDVSTGGLR